MGVPPILFHLSFKISISFDLLFHFFISSNFTSSATENIDIKLKIFKQLDEICDENTILGTNTSSISITKIGSVTNRDITMNGANFIFEGNLENAFETTLTVEEPTADRILTLPNSSGTIGTADDALAYSVVFGS